VVEEVEVVIKVVVLVIVAVAVADQYSYTIYKDCTNRVEAGIRIYTIRNKRLSIIFRCKHVLSGNV